jgi:hypothetical protein
MQAEDRGCHGSVKRQRPLARNHETRELRAPMTEAAPTTAEPQRLRALSRANKIRLERAVLKRRIAAGEVSAAEVILNPPQSAETWSVGDLLMSQRRWGTTRCRRFLARNSIVETKHIGTLTERQKKLLAESLAPALGERTPEMSRDLEMAVA